jgi:uncharacterized NAD(P)/FAD-binding protein YdhS
MRPDGFDPARPSVQRTAGEGPVRADQRPIVIVGGGFSGAMLAARLAERGLAATLIDATGRFGLGVAYATPFDGHLLNVRAARMSAIEGRPDDFVQWLAQAHPGHAHPDAFAPRRLFGLYVQERLTAVESTCPGLIARLHGRVEAIEGTGVVLADGRRLQGRAVVLATGNPPPRSASGDLRILSDPWSDGALDAVGPTDDLAVIGSGLTMVDMAVWTGRMTALSRRGLSPRPHGPRPDPAAPPGEALTRGPASRRLQAARRAAGEHGWREVMEGLRPMTDRLWRAADVDVRARWVRHLRPWWDVHRHRIAPEVAAQIDALTASGRLSVAAARIGSIETTPDGVVVTFRPKGSAVPRTLVADRLIDCSGPGHDPGRDPLTSPLIAAGRARLDPLRLGLDLDEAGRVLSAGGTPDPALFVLGPPARAAFWETVAVPDVRQRIEAVVAALDA